MARQSRYFRPETEIDLTMTLLDEKEPGVSLKLIIIIVSVVIGGFFSTLFLLNGGSQAQSGHTHQAQSASQASS